MNGEIRTHAAHRRSDGFADRGLNPLDYVHILVLPMRVERISVAYKATALTTELWQYKEPKLLYIFPFLIRIRVDFFFS